MNRMDTKFVFHAGKFGSILSRLHGNYNILTINGLSVRKYDTWHFDTVDFKLYLAHHNGKMNRFKIREREYLQDKISYLEIKFKTNKGRTDKKRIKIGDPEAGFDEKSRNFIRKNTGFDPDSLQVQLENTFDRITLVHKTRNERITLDFNLCYRKEGRTLSLPHLVIAEVKQEKYSFSSEFIRLLHDEKIRSGNFSKYCIGTVLFNKELKYNRFKEKLLLINKIEHAFTSAS